ncbi:hypothetical protein ACFWY5_17820 [Nonomuraea sp. NPDC059007]
MDIANGVALVTGDVLIQRGTPHAWSNRSGEVCVPACVAIGADAATRPQ